ncbi:MAG: ATP-dependent Clp protease ATP-binding subunit [Candidatus Abyssobacteria bacterium SURF_5]|uniref:ATP-dependent Clp protease ATP-binding subunit n=1 Tax=Abyssobacteria bacterium (strain SURF_5) TaxID=2093360 RepID=A0A3A4NS76_ABYX5|nr:MAG: ATP-dependent Clp protease ATP-binding subunit [Candidatus Abyssubacteria bacterium SURF_5]
MELSPGGRLLVAVAIAETTFTKCKEIEPEHFFAALCKIPDLPRQIIEEVVGTSADTVNRVNRERAAVHEKLMKARIDPVQTRRRVRRMIGKETALLGQFTEKLSQRGHRVFQSAERRAMSLGEAPVQPLHILWAILSEGSSLLQQVFGDTKGAWTLLCNQCGVPPPVIHAPEDEIEGIVVINDIEIPPEPPAQRAAPKPSAHPPTPFLDKFGRDLTALARAGKLSSCIGRREEMRTMAQILRRRTKNAPVLVGDAGVGKTCIVEGLAHRVVHPQAPQTIRDWRIVEISMGSLIAGTTLRGMFEERLQNVVNEAKSDQHLILFIDEIHTLVGAGGSSESGMDAGQILKPALARGEVRLIGATTTAEYRKYIEADAALERRMQMVWVNEPTGEEAIEILDGVRSTLEKHHGVFITHDAVVRAVEWSMRYLPDRRLPDKALDIIDQACTAEIMKTLSPVARFNAIQPNPSIGTPPAQVTEEDIARVISERCRIPVGMIAVDDAQRLLRLDETLARRVMGQDEAIRQVADTVRTARAGLKKPNRPVGVFLFLGPTGTGKTELAKALAEALFGNEEALLRFDMSEYGEKHNVARLIGAPPGYIGHDEEGQLTGRVRTRPYSVILFDEIEKAHKDVFDVFLQIFDDGRLTDSKGRRASFTESIIIMTSNLGTSAGPAPQKRDIGVSLGPPAEPTGERNIAQQKNEQERRVQEALTGAFRPELLNRIDRKIVFAPLSREVVTRILEKLIDGLNKRLEDQSVECEFSQEVRDLIMEKGYSETYGARELERVFETLITTPLARALLEGRVETGQTVRFELRNGEIRFA